MTSIAATAHASSFTLDSNSSTVTYAGSSGTSSTPVSFGSSTFNIGTGGGVWAGPIGTSSWVSFNPNNAPGGSYVAPGGTYNYDASFTAAAGDSGTIWILADDTTSIYLNNILVEAPTNTSAASACTVGTPNCEDAVEFTLPSADFVNGSNELSFGVQQLYGSATGLDFEATISTPSATPEPSSLMLFGTGLLGAAGLIRRRFVAVVRA